jgi:hypothetical protein
MSQKEDDIAGLLGDSYPGSWRTGITSADEPRLHCSYSISSLVRLQFATRNTDATVKEDVHEVCAYEDMFKAGF